MKDVWCWRLLYRNDALLHMSLHETASACNRGSTGAPVCFMNARRIMISRLLTKPVAIYKSRDRQCRS